MKTSLRFRATALVAPALVVLALAPTARAIEIDFNVDSGYSVKGGRFGNGTLAGQRQEDSRTTWRGPSKVGADVLRVVPDTGGGQVLKAHLVMEPVQAAYIFDTSLEDLRGDFDPAGSRIGFSFRMRYDDAPEGQTRALVRLQIGDTPAPVATFEFLTDGRLHFNNGGKYNNLASGKGGGVLKARRGEWVVVSGTLNYATETYTLSVNGVPQQEGKVANLGFRSPAKTQRTPALSIRDMSAEGDAFLAYSFDDLVLRVIP